MRNISANGLAKIANKLGNESIVILEVEWVPLAPAAVYSDKDLIGASGVTVIPGTILELGDLDNVTNLSGSGSSQELAVTLDDTDGTLKNILDTNDIHKRTARIYQYFSGLDLSDKFLLFTGTVSSPIVWSERDRTVKFSIISRLETSEVGFSAEDGNFPYLPANLVGKVWPTVFGKVLNVPTVQVPQAVSGTTLNGIGILSGVSVWLGSEFGDEESQFYASLQMAYLQEGDLLTMGTCWARANPALSQNYVDQANAIAYQISTAIAKFRRAQACALAARMHDIEIATADGNGGDIIQVLGGEDFPQGQTITLNINGGWFTGYFSGNTFNIYDRIQNDLEAVAAANYAARQSTCGKEAQRQTYSFSAAVPCDSFCGSFGDPCNYTHNTWVVTQPTITHYQTPESIAQQFWADAGAPVYILGQEPKTYIVSTTPGTVLSVKAYKKFNGGQTLLEVPPDYYTVRSQNYGPVTAVEVVLNDLLSLIFDPTDGVNAGWSDDMYVTFESTIGPDIVSIIRYLIANHTDLNWDDPSFNYCQTKLAPYPANFALLDRKDILQVLQDIAFQSRCAIWLDDDVFKMKYLPEEPTPVDTITVSDIDADHGLEISLTPTESLITKMKVTWRLGLAAFTAYGTSPEMIMILRHNMEKYSLTEQSYDWYIFNQPDIIYKMATFWLIRNSITWKTVKFQTYLTKLNLETFDAVTLNLPQVATDPVVAIITKANYNSADNVIDVECALPIEAGSMVPNPFYWPANLPATTTWPTQADIDSGNAGGPYPSVVGPLPVGDVSHLALPSEQVIMVGGPNVVYMAHSSWGDRTPTDTGFSAQTTLNSSVYSNLPSGTRPKLFLGNNIPLSQPPILLPQTGSGITIDIRKTKITDSQSPGTSAFLSSLIFGINLNGQLTLDRTKARVADPTQPNGQLISDVFANGSQLAIKTTVMMSDTTSGEGVFDYKYDSKGKKFGAGTAFLQD